MIDFKVTESGWYRTRDGRDAEVVVNPKASFSAIGYIVDGSYTDTWRRNGQYSTAGDGPLDLVEYFGKERPKQKKVKKCKAKISLWSCGHITTEGSNILLSHDSFVVETREIQWEVPDNG